MASEQERKEAFLRAWFGVPEGVHWAHGMSNEVEQGISDCFDQAIAAWNTRPTPTATDTGLVTVGTAAKFGQMTRAVFNAATVPVGSAVCLRSQAEELLAAERAEKERLRGLLTSATYDLARANDECGALTIDNAAKDARVEELIGTNIAVARRQEELANQLAETKGLLKTADDLAWQRGATIEALEAKLAAAERVRVAAERVVWFDWSDNDDDAVKAVSDLRAVLEGKPYKCEWQQRAETAETKLAAAEMALEPFSYIAGELFAANFNNDDVVFKLHRKTAKGSKLSYQMTAKAFFEARAVLGGKP
ncbi:hypothetical protein [Brucella intermedia]|uniref:hypothetical protein n=1 Tax=Brucella intermedia TaxID=94625 RepID=UPI0007C75A08|nr:hypothetical protein [Brucella intermedia]OAE39681.1 hypothetical protein A7J42_14335 [Brucella intermedia]